MALTVFGFLIIGLLVNSSTVNYTPYNVKMHAPAFLSSETACNGKPFINRTYTWSRYYDGYSLTQLGDGGFAIAGFVSNISVNPDYWLVRTDAQGKALWNRTYNLNSDTCRKVIKCQDGGFALFGEGGNPYGGNYADYWLVKTYANGTPQWNRTYGHSGNDNGYDAVEVAGGGFALFGGAYNTTTDDFDYWLVRVNATGYKMWDRWYGGQYGEIGSSLLSTNDGGFLLVGTTNINVAQAQDGYVVKTDSMGNTIWNRRYGGNDTDVLYSAIKTNDGGYALVGFSRSPPSQGNNEAWLLIISSNGTVRSEHRYDKLDFGAIAQAVAQAPDGGFAIVGTYQNSPPETEASVCHAPTVVSALNPGYSAWYIRTDANGNALWDFTFGADNDLPRSVIPVAGGGFALTGTTTQNTAGYAGASLILFPELSWLNDPEGATIPFGSPVHIDLNATSAAGIDMWSLNDTAKFSIDSHGIITNIVALSTGYYGLRVNVNDTVGNLLVADVTIHVLPATTGDSGTLLILVGTGIGVAAVVFGLGLVLRRKQS